MSNLLRFRIVVFFIASLCLSCTKIGTTNVGGGLIPSSDQVFTSDTTLDVVAYNIQDPKDTTKIYLSDSHIVGSIINDPIFRTTSAYFYFEPKPPIFPYVNPINRDSIVSVDSVYLLLGYEGAYGDSSDNATVTVQVQEVNQPGLMFMNYPVQYPNFVPIITKNIVGFENKVLYPKNLNDSVITNFERTKGLIRIPLPVAWGTPFLLTYDTDFTYKNAVNYRATFAGFKVQDVGSNTNTLLSVSLVSNTYLAFYYRYKNNGRIDSAVTYFSSIIYNDESNNLLTRQANFVVRSYTPPTPQAPIKGDSLLYIQTYPGTAAVLTIPGLSKLSNRIINRAELIVYQEPQNVYYDNLYPPPNYLLLAAYDSTRGAKRNIRNDYYIDANNYVDLNYFGGAQKKTTINGQSVTTYVFNISRYVQGIITRKDTILNLRLYAPTNDEVLYQPPYPNTAYPAYDNDGNAYRIGITPLSANTTAFGRVVLGGGVGNTSPYRMVLRIVYTKI
ncbi:MAG: hypothetical protein QM528_01835 [Phycisphaerales bacterium]|nr:hypothetical protein [Phycisphaerales bacterium]